VTTTRLIFGSSNRPVTIRRKVSLLQPRHDALKITVRTQHGVAAKNCIADLG
jgi:hypothetical protein